jgi:membrane protein
MLRELAQARDLATHGLSAAQLSETMRTDPLQIEPLLDTLVAIDWVGRLDEEGSARYVLLCDPACTLAQPLLARVLLDPAASLRGFWQQAGFAQMTLLDLIKNQPSGSEPNLAGPDVLVHDPVRHETEYRSLE